MCELEGPTIYRNRSGLEVAVLSACSRSWTVGSVLTLFELGGEATVQRGEKRLCLVWLSKPDVVVDRSITQAWCQTLGGDPENCVRASRSVPERPCALALYHQHTCQINSLLSVEARFSILVSQQALREFTDVIPGGDASFASGHLRKTPSRRCEVSSVPTIQLQAAVAS